MSATTFVDVLEEMLHVRRCLDRLHFDVLHGNKERAQHWMSDLEESVKRLRPLVEDFTPVPLSEDATIN